MENYIVTETDEPIEKERLKVPGNEIIGVVNPRKMRAIGTCLSILAISIIVFIVFHLKQKLEFSRFTESIKNAKNAGAVIESRLKGVEHEQLLATCAFGGIVLILLFRIIYLLYNCDK